MLRQLTLFGHRGASIELPENTLEAFERALELGADVIETDVHVTSDGHVVIHHDDTGQRTASNRAAVARSTLDEVRRWNVGFGFRDREGRGIDAPSFRVPRLDEALEAFPDVRFNVDIKPSGAASAVLDVVARCRAADRVLLTSFYDDVVAQVRDSGYAGETGLAQREALRALALPTWAPPGFRPRGNRLQIPCSAGPLSLARPGLIARMKALGYRVDFWVVNDATLASALAGMGADGIMTDDPRTIAPAIGKG